MSRELLTSFFKETATRVRYIFQKSPRLISITMHPFIKEEFLKLLKSLVPDDYDKLSWIGITILASDENEDEARKKTIKNGFGYIICDYDNETIINAKWRPLIDGGHALNEHLSTRYSLFKLFSEGKIKKYDRIYLYNSDKKDDGCHLDPIILTGGDRRLAHKFLAEDLHLTAHEITQFDSYLDFLLNNPEIIFYCAMPLFQHPFIKQSPGEIYIAAKSVLEKKSVNSILECLEKIALAFSVMIEKQSRDEIKQNKATLVTLINNIKSASYEIISTASIEIADENEKPKFKFMNIIKQIEKKMAEQPIGKSDNPYKELMNFCETIFKERIDFTDLGVAEGDSVRHILSRSEETRLFRVLPAKVNSIVLANLKNVMPKDIGFNSETYVSDFAEYIKPKKYTQKSTLLEFEEYWWPLLGFEKKTSYWKMYWEDMIGVEKVKLEYDPDKSHYHLFPFFAYIFNSLFSNRTDRQAPTSCDIKTFSTQVTSEATITWDKSAYVNEPETITVNKILTKPIGAHHLAGRLFFIKNIFFDISGEGISLEADKIMFNIRLTHFRG